jgi:hypothetical protein
MPLELVNKPEREETKEPPGVVLRQDNPVCPINSAMPPGPSPVTLGKLLRADRKEEALVPNEPKLKEPMAEDKEDKADKPSVIPWIFIIDCKPVTPDMEDKTVELRLAMDDNKFEPVNPAMD